MLLSILIVQAIVIVIVIAIAKWSSAQVVIDNTHVPNALLMTAMKWGIAHLMVLIWNADKILGVLYIAILLVLKVFTLKMIQTLLRIHAERIYKNVFVICRMMEAETVLILWLLISLMMFTITFL